jgi:hypothetical protein
VWRTWHETMRMSAEEHEAEFQADVLDTMVEVCLTGFMPRRFVLTHSIRSVLAKRYLPVWCVLYSLSPSATLLTSLHSNRAPIWLAGRRLLSSTGLTVVGAVLHAGVTVFTTSAICTILPACSLQGTQLPWGNNVLPDWHFLYSMI